jgi:hypothetical protein
MSRAVSTRFRSHHVASRKEETHREREADKQWRDKGWGERNWRTHSANSSVNACTRINHDIIMHIVQIRSHVITDGQSVSMSTYRAHFGLETRYYFLSEGCFLKIAVLSLWGALSDERSGSVICLSQSTNWPLFTSNIYVTCVLQFSNLYTIYTSFFQSRIGTVDYALLVVICPNYRSSPDTWTVV